MKQSIIICALIVLSIVSCDKDKACHDSSLPCTEINPPEDCDDPRPESVECPFVNMPQDLTNIMTIAANSEPGERIVLRGKVFESDGITPHPNVILYCYQTNADGIYPKYGNETGIFAWHGYLHGWCITNENGEYEIRTIRPGQYPTHEYPAHIHCHVRNPDCHCTTFYICDFVFSDDSLVNNNYLNSLDCNSDNGVVTLQPDSTGVMTGMRNIILEK